MRQCVTLAVVLAVLVVGAATPASGIARSTAESAGPSVGPQTHESVAVTVYDVVDGDTLHVRYDDGSTDTVRLLGVDTPEVHSANTPDEFEGVPNTEAGGECLRQYGEVASDHAKGQLLDQRVTLVFDDQADRRGTYGRLLAYVYHDGANFNEDLISGGYARVYDSAFQKSDEFYAAEDGAQSAHRRLWSCQDGGNIEVSYVREDAWGTDGDHLNDEYVVFENVGSTTLYTSGWTVADEASHQHTFSGSVWVAPGETLVLHSGSGTGTETDRYWGSSTPIWNNDGDTVYVYEDGTTLVEQYAY